MAAKVSICGTLIDPFTLAEASEKILAHAAGSAAPAYVVTPNAQHLVLLRSDGAFRDAYRDALLVVPDGVSLLWAARLLGTPLRERVNGTDLFETLCAATKGRGLKAFLLGGQPGSAEAATAVLKSRHPGLQLSYHYPPLGFEKDPTQFSTILSKVRSFAPHLLFVGVGSPKGELWIHAHYRELGVPVSIGVGASIDFVAGRIRRAPRPMQRSGLEWLYRLMTEPRRLWRRYLIGNPQFIGLVLKQRLGMLKESR